MPSQTRSSSRIRSSAAKKIQKRFRSRKIKIQRQRSKATRKIQSIARAKIQGKQTRKLINRVKTTMLTDNNCPVCLEPMTSTEKIATLLPCGHRFHTKCIKASLPTTRGECPLCRTGVVNIPYVQPGRANRTFGNIPLSQQQPPPPPQSLIVEPEEQEQEEEEEQVEEIRLQIIFIQVQLLENQIAIMRQQLPEPPTVPNITLNEALNNQTMAAQIERRAARNHTEVAVYYNNLRTMRQRTRPNWTGADETEAINQTIFNLYNYTSEVLANAINNTRNASRILVVIGNRYN